MENINTLNKPRIIWFAYPKKGGWAFEVRTYNLISCLPEFNHIVLPPVYNLKMVEGILDNADIIIIWNDTQYDTIQDYNKRKIIQCFTGHRMTESILQGPQRVNPYSNISLLIAESYRRAGLHGDGAC